VLLSLEERAASGKILHVHQTGDETKKSSHAIRKERPLALMGCWHFRWRPEPVLGLWLRRKAGENQ
jgi:hypothetical protein